MNSQTKEPVPYAAVGLLKAKNGVSANENGIFQLGEISLDDTLLVSCFGYVTKRICSSNVKDEIELSPITQVFEENATKPKKSKTTSANSFKRNSTYHTLKNSGGFSQIAQLITYPASNTWFIKSLKIGRVNRTHNDRRLPAMFKIRFYGINALNKPDSVDIFEAIMVKDENNGIIELDMMSKELELPPKGIFVAVEWLTTDQNYFEEKVTYIIGDKDMKNKTTQGYYSPILTFNSKIGKIENCHIFAMGYDGIWKKGCFPMGDGSCSPDLNISLTITD